MFYNRCRLLFSPSSHKQSVAKSDRATRDESTQSQVYLSIVCGGVIDLLSHCKMHRRRTHNGCKTCDEMERESQSTFPMTCCHVNRRGQWSWSHDTWHIMRSTVTRIPDNICWFNAPRLHTQIQTARKHLPIREYGWFSLILLDCYGSEREREKYTEHTGYHEDGHFAFDVHRHVKCVASVAKVVHLANSQVTSM